MAIDLSQLPAPTVVEPLDFETIFAAMLADLQARNPVFTALVESDPAYTILEVAAYREVLIRQRVNDGARAVMLASAQGADLDQLGALFGVARLVVEPGDPTAVPPVEPTYETDARLRARIQLAPEAVTTAGAGGAYLFHALSADATVADIALTSPSPGEVVVTVLSTIGDGTPDQALLDTVAAALTAEDVRPLTDQVIVQAPTILPYTVTATLDTYPGPDPAVVATAAQAAVQRYADDHHKMGFDIPLSGLYAALHQPGVQKVTLTSPVADLTVQPTEVAYATAITLTTGVVAE